MARKNKDWHGDFKYGIPDFSMAYHYSYFKSLGEDTHPNANRRGLWAHSHKLGLFNQATDAYNNKLKEIDSENAHENFSTAIKFIQQVAENERNNELTVVRAYCRKLHQKFPFTAEEITSEAILKDPENFYTKLTALINKARLGALEYKRQLKRIKNNAAGAKKSLKDYFTNDYRYRLSGDINALIKKMIGTYRNETAKALDTFTHKINKMAIEIVTSSDVMNQIKSGEDFVAIAAAVLIDLEKRASEELEKQNQDDFTQLSEETLQKIEQTYLKEMQSSKKATQLTAVQRALLDIENPEFARITENVKDMLGISTMAVGSKGYLAQGKYILEKIKKRDKKSKIEKNAIAEIQSVFESNAKLKKSMRAIHFDKADTNIAHGNMYEIITSVLSDYTTKKAGKSAAVDLFTISANLDIKSDDAILNDLLSELTEITNQVKVKTDEENDSAERDLTTAIDQMNSQIDAIMTKIDQRLKELNSKEFSDLFVFHESLKLYSSVETGVYKHWGGHSGFGGRNMNALSYVDFVISAANSAGIGTPVDRDTLAFLILNLPHEAVGLGNVDTLTRYFSIFAGLLMFDDVVNMAKAAVSSVEANTSTHQVHLYLLNGIYVPASMILSYVANAIEPAAKLAEDDYAARAEIYYSEADSSIGAWKPKTDNKGRTIYLTRADWEKMGNEVASGVKINITFLNSFLSFVNKLSNL